jgi:hypothetical protein
MIDGQCHGKRDAMRATFISGDGLAGRPEPVCQLLLRKPQGLSRFLEMIGSHGIRYGATALSAI